MDKFKQFIQYYYLDGIVDRVTIKNEGGTVSINFCSKGQTLYGKVVGVNILPNVFDFEISFSDSKSLLKALKVIKDPQFELLNSLQGTPYKLKVTPKGKSLPSARVSLFAGNVKRPSEQSLQKILNCQKIYEFTVDTAFRNELTNASSLVDKINSLVLDTDEHTITADDGHNDYTFTVNTNSIGGYGELILPMKELTAILKVLNDDFVFVLHQVGDKNMFSIQTVTGDFNITYFIPPLIHK